MAKTKFFRIGVEGPTVDGREITRDMIDQMATSYNPETYTANINCEHIPGFSPEPPFNSWGKVIALKADDVEVTLDGKTQKRRALFGQFDITDQAKAFNQAGQKLFSSMEVVTNFAKTGKAYLGGLAFTDNPASLATEALKFSRDDRKADDLKQIGDAFELSYEDAAPGGNAMADAFSSMANFFKSLVEKPAATTVETPPEKTGDADNFARFAAGFGEQMEKLNSTIAAGFAARDTAHASLVQQFTALKADVESQESPRYKRREKTGGVDEANLTDF